MFKFIYISSILYSSHVYICMLIPYLYKYTFTLKYNIRSWVPPSKPTHHVEALRLC